MYIQSTIKAAGLGVYKSLSKSTLNNIYNIYSIWRLHDIDGCHTSMWEFTQDFLKNQVYDFELMEYNTREFVPCISLKSAPLSSSNTQSCFQYSLGYLFCNSYLKQSADLINEPHHEKINNVFLAHLSH